MFIEDAELLISLDFLVGLSVVNIKVGSIILGRVLLREFVELIAKVFLLVCLLALFVVINSVLINSDWMDIVVAFVIGVVVAVLI